MASPIRSSDLSSSSPRSTPSRTFQNGNKRVNGFHRPHRDSVDDSPSRQLLAEFGRMLVNDDRAFKRSLDEQTAAQQKLHIEALDRALAKHDEVRTSAERARERVELEIERERIRREEEEKKALEKARQDLEEQKLAQQRRELEHAKVREEERRKREELQRDQEEARRNAEAQKQREDEESRQWSKTRRQQEAAEASRRATEETAVRGEPRLQSVGRQDSNGPQVQRPSSATQQAASAPVQPNGVSALSRLTPSTSQAQSTSENSSQPSANLPKGLVSSPEERDAVHNRYLDLHKRLKQMRVEVSEEVKKVSGLKNQLSDWRRSIHKCIGQLGKGTGEDVKAGNRRAMLEIQQHLDAAAGVAEPTIDVTQYLIQNHQPPDANKQGPAVLVFLLNHFAKNIVSQFISESAVDPKTADAIGVLAVSMFARPNYLFNGQSLIDLLWAKYHKHCPVLFGISASERTQAGRTKLGWQMEGGAFVPNQEHYVRMSGLGAGFAALTLRDFSKSKNVNPAPNRIYWESLARILNTPAQQIQPTHFVVLKAMIETSVSRIISLFGGAGVAALRQALIVFPNEKGLQDENGKRPPAVSALQAMPMLLQRDLHLTL